MAIKRLTGFLHMNSSSQTFLAQSAKLLRPSDMLTGQSFLSTSLVDVVPPPSGGPTCQVVVLQLGGLLREGQWRKRLINQFIGEDSRVIFRTAQHKGIAEIKLKKKNNENEFISKKTHLINSYQSYKEM